MLVTLGKVGESNLVKDQSEYDLPAHFWSNGKNVRFFNNHVERMLGHQLFATGTVAPQWLLSTRWGSSYYVVYAGTAAVYVYDYTSHTDITRIASAYTAGQNAWTGGVLHGIVYLNNGSDVPQQWVIPPNVATKLVALTNWPAANRCGALRQFGNFLVAMDITKSGTRFPQLVAWSHPADPGSVPSSWDPTDATKDAGEIPISESAAAVVDGATLRGNFMLYKEDSLHVMTFVGGSKVMSIRRVSEDTGLIARNCIGVFSHQGEQQAAFGPDDCYMTDGINVQSILSGTWRRWLYNNINSAQSGKSFVAVNTFYKEIWFCFAESGATLPTLALIWNYVTKQFGIRELPQCSHITHGVPSQPGLGAWSSSSATWATITGTWADGAGVQPVEKLIMAVPSNNKIMLMDVTNQFDGVNFESYIERVGMTAFAQDYKGNLVQDMTSMKLMTELWPHITADAGTQVFVQVAKQDAMNTTITWSAELTYQHGSVNKVNPFVGGRFLGVRFKSSSNAFWKLRDYDVELTKTGKY